MSELRMKVREKIYSATAATDTNSNTNAVIVFLGKLSSEKFKEYTKKFTSDLLNHRIAEERFTFVEVDSGSDDIAEKVYEAVKGIKNLSQQNMNKIFVSFVTIMEDDFYANEKKIDLGRLDQVRENLFLGYPVTLHYDFYGIFTAGTAFENRNNARSMIIDFLGQDSSSIWVKNIYHCVCAGEDYYRCAKSVSFLILLNLTEKLDAHDLAKYSVEGKDYAWTTFFLFEKNLTSLVVYELIGMLLDRNTTGAEAITVETLRSVIFEAIEEKGKRLEAAVPASDVLYIPFRVRKKKRELSFMEKLKSRFVEIKDVDVYLLEDETADTIQLIEYQKKALAEALEKELTGKFMDELFGKLIRMCKAVSSVDLTDGKSLIIDALDLCKSSLESEKKNARMAQTEYYMIKHYEMVADAKITLVETLKEYYNANAERYVREIVLDLDKKNAEVSALIKEFATLGAHFAGKDALVFGKSIPLLCSYDEILNEIEIEKVIEAINNDPAIFGNVLKSYLPSVKIAAEHIKTFGGLNINPQSDILRLYSAETVATPQGLEIASDEYWFRNHEIAILYTARNRPEDCKHLPYGNN